MGSRGSMALPPHLQDIAGERIDDEVDLLGERLEGEPHLVFEFMAIVGLTDYADGVA